MLCVRRRSDSVPVGMVNWSGVVMQGAQKQGRKRFNSITKTIPFAHLGILFIYAFCSLCRVHPVVDFEGRVTFDPPVIGPTSMTGFLVTACAKVKSR